MFGGTLLCNLRERTRLETRQGCAARQFIRQTVSVLRSVTLIVSLYILVFLTVLLHSHYSLCVCLRVCV